MGTFAPGSAAPGSRGATGERGSLSIEMIFMFPLMLSIMFLGVQVAMWYHARTVILAAAQEGARATAVEGGTEAAGESAANAFVAGSAGLIKNANVTASRGAEEVVVTVAGRTPGLFPGYDPLIRQEARRPVERLTRPDCMYVDYRTPGGDATQLGTKQVCGLK